MSDWELPSEFGKFRGPPSINAVNRCAPGFTVYKTGKGDGVTTNPGYRNGPRLIFDPSNKIRDFQMLGLWYLIGGTVVWEGADIEDYMDAKLVAPATVGTQTAGDYNKVALGGGANVYVPAAPGAGAWSLDLAAKHTGTNVLKCVPVPKAGNTGYFDYNINTNTLTINNTMTGGYNLYDFEASLQYLAAGIPGKKVDGAATDLDVTEMIGKILPPHWVIRVELVTQKMSGIKTAVSMTTAVKGNI